MKNKYYGDKRDLVKWGTLVHLCGIHNLHAIIQVAFLRADDPLLGLNGPDGTFQLPAQVWAHFRNIIKIKELQMPGIDIVVIDHIFDPNQRSVYARHVISNFSEIKQPGRLLFLDPDTGISPARTKPEHVTKAEIKEYWDALNPGDCLVLYQHAQRTTDWRDNCKTQFEAACGNVQANIYDCPDIAHDVAFFAALKQ